jgi:hypothetical protein
MADSRWWQPAVNQALHPSSSDTALLAASRKHAVPSPAHLSPEGAQHRAIRGHPIVAGMPTNNGAKPLAYLGDRGTLDDLVFQRGHSERSLPPVGLLYILHHIHSLKMLRMAYFSLKKEASPGVDGETWRHYGEELEKNLQDPHDSGPMWVATSHACDFFIHYTSPV